MHKFFKNLCQLFKYREWKCNNKKKQNKIRKID